MSRKWIVAALLLAACDRAPEKLAVAKVEADPFAGARAAVLLRLKDPDSARFGQIAHGKAGAICGEVNARNSYGGYTGMTPFMLTADGAFMAYDNTGDWGDKGIQAEMFEKRGCSIGPEHAKALEVRRLLDASNRRVAEMSGK